MAYLSGEPTFCRALFSCLFSRKINQRRFNLLKPYFRVPHWMQSQVSSMDASHTVMGDASRAGLGFVAMFVLMSLMAPAPLHAAKRMDSAVYGSSSAPYWTVGKYNAKLSTACQERRFGQKRHYRYIISFVGNRGRGVIGIASKYWNLHDPAGLAQADKTYHFFNDGFSDCSVFVSPQPGY